MENIKPRKGLKKTVIVLAAILAVLFFLIWLFLNAPSDYTDNFSKSGGIPSEEIFKNTDSDPFIGNKNTAKIQMVEFGDFQCAYCHQAFPVVREIMEKYKNDLFFVFRDFPVLDAHPDALNSAIAASCANEQGKFWQMHDKLYINQENLTEDDLKNYVLQIGLDLAEFSICYADSKNKDEVAVDYDDGLALGVSGTPTFFINGYKISGAIPRDVFFNIMDMALKEKN